MISLDADSLRQQACAASPPPTTHTLTANPLHSPVYGVIFLFKYQSSSGTDDSANVQDGRFDFEATENVFFANQVIQNACATQAILSVLLNRPDIEVGTELREFREFTQAFPSDVGGAVTHRSRDGCADAL